MQFGQAQARSSSIPGSPLGGLHSVEVVFYRDSTALVRLAAPRRGGTAPAGHRCWTGPDPVPSSSWQSQRFAPRAQAHGSVWASVVGSAVPEAHRKRVGTGWDTGRSSAGLAFAPKARDPLWILRRVAGQPQALVFARFGEQQLLLETHFLSHHVCGRTARRVVVRTPFPSLCSGRRRWHSAGAVSPAA